MNERVELVGEWSVPGERSKPWSGRLAFDPLAGIELDVAGSGPGLAFPRDPFETPVMHGFTVDAKRVTLVHCVQTSSQTTIGGGYTATYSARYALVGAHFDRPEAIAFDELRVRMTDVGEWLGVSGFSFAAPRPDAFAVDYEVPDDLTVAVALPLEIGVSFAATRQTGPERTFTTRELNVVQEDWLTLRSPEPVPFATLADVLGRIRSFFCFVARDRVDYLAITASAELRDPDGDNGASRRETVTVLFRPNVVIEPRRGPVDSQRMLFTHADCAPGAASPLSRWLAEEGRLGPIYDLFLVSLFQPRIFLELQFISLSQALESLHSRTYPHYELPRAQHRARIKEIVDAVPDAHREWVREKLAYSNKATFRQSVTDLLATLPDVLRLAMGDEPAFAKRVHRTRNYLTHWDPDLERDAARGEELTRLTMALKVIVEALLLLELGFSKEEVAALVERNEDYKRNVNFAFFRRRTSAVTGATVAEDDAAEESGNAAMAVEPPAAETAG